MRASSIFAAGLLLTACGKGGRATPAPEPRRTGVIDSHVHLDFWPVASELAAAGIAGAVDLGGPIEDLDDEWPLAVFGSGPMISAPGGYPANAWAPASYAIECADTACATRAVARLDAAGARVVKMPFGTDGVAPVVAAAAAIEAHARGLRVACHALGDRDAAEAAAAGCDILAHTPVEALSDATVEAWRARAVISTLAAFDGGRDAVENLRRLRQVGATVLYGTDLGNRRVIGVDAEELELLRAAGLDDAAIDEAMTTAPARFWRLELTP